MTRLFLLAFSLAVTACNAPATVPVQDAKPSAEAVAALDKVMPGGPHLIGAAEVGALWLFYPASGDAKGAEPARPDSYVHALSRRFGPVAGASLAAAPLHARWDAEPLAGKHPLLVFAPGAGMGGRDYRLLFEALVSRGYAVAVLDPLGSPPVSAERYGQIADSFAAATATLRSDPRWSKKLDFDRMVLAGHSIGGASAVLGLARVAGARGAINLDGDYGGASLAPAPDRPILYLTGFTEGETQASIDRRAGEWNLVRGTGKSAVRVPLVQMRHFDFADAALLPVETVPDARRQNRFGPMGGRRAHDLTVELMLAFLGEVLEGKQGALATAIEATR